MRMTCFWWIVVTPFFQKVREKLNLEKYRNIYILITHLHPDHAGSLGQLVLYLNYVLAKKPTVVTRCEKMPVFLSSIGVNEELYSLPRNTTLNLQFIKTEHVSELDAYGFSLEMQGKKMVYTGDTSTLEPFKPYLEQADELYVDVSKNGAVHLSIDQCLSELLAIQAHGTKVYLMHMDDEEYIAKVAQGRLEFARLVC